ncbi:AzlD family protein [Nitrospirillum bahiense]|uniref:Putative membrane protein n=1 Tax=Nitrospirillum amazonense TaxID=28077 RepID=A0A560FKT2_9PROT|nr:AzlD family protein [Nitrospirillum amazonense]TWB22217.1 putative membrane protein [Nitrospirillum amazonense]
MSDFARYFALDVPSLLAILAMMAVTYATRVTGYLVLRNRTLSPRATAVLEAVPGAVLISVIAPAFTTTNPADLLGLAVTLAMACRFPMLPTVIVGVAVTALLRHVL